MKPLNESLEQFERELILKALGLAGGKRGKAADLLGITRKTLWQKVKARGITLKEIGAAMAQADNDVDAPPAKEQA